MTQKQAFSHGKKARGSAKADTTAGYPSTFGYIRFHVEHRGWFAHRLAFLYMTGTVPDMVDHINRDRSDNRWINLRPATRQDNNRNCKMKQSNTSGVKGVRWARKAKKWEARIRFNGKQRTIGYFPDLIGAELALVKRRNELHGAFARHL